MHSVMSVVSRRPRASSAASRPARRTKLPQPIVPLSKPTSELEATAAFPSSTEHSWWKNQANSRQFLQWLADRLQVKDRKDWYLVTRSALLQAGGNRMLVAFGYSLPQILKELVPNHRWEAHRFRRQSSDVWDWSIASNQKSFVSSLMTKFDSTWTEKKLDALYLLTHKQINQFGGSSLLRLYKHSLLDMLRAIYPEHEWQGWKFGHSARNFWTDQSNLLAFLQHLRRLKGWNALEDMYAISSDDFMVNGAAGALAHHGHSPSQLVMNAYPEHEWYPWKFSVVSRNYWSKRENQKRYFDWLTRTKLQIPDLNGLYSLTFNHFTTNHGSALIGLFGGSPSEVVRAMVPNHNWLPWKFSPVPNKWWANKENQRRFMDWLLKERNATDLSEAYSLTREDIIRQGGGWFFTKYGSIGEMLREVYPEHQWEAWKFDRIKKSLSTSTSQQLSFVNWIKENQGYKTLEDFYKLRLADLKEHSGSLFSTDQESVLKLLSSVFPDHDWLPWKFQNVPTGWWGSLSNRQRFFDWLRQQLGYKSLDDFYRLTQQQLVKTAGSGILKAVQEPWSSILMQTYPLHHWDEWKFVMTPKGWWKNLANQRKFLNHVRTVYGLYTQDSLYRLTAKHIQTEGGGALLKLKPVARLVSEAFPEFIWDLTKFMRPKTSVEELLRATLSAHYGRDSVSTRPVKPSHSSVEIDVTVQRKNVVFEFQGERHFFDVLVYGDREVFESRDAAKTVLLAHSGLALVEVPFWWTGDKAELLRTIRAFD